MSSKSYSATYLEALLAIATATGVGVLLLPNSAERIERSASLALHDPWLWFTEKKTKKKPGSFLSAAQVQVGGDTDIAHFVTPAKERSP